MIPMNNLSIFVKRVGKIFADNSPTILTGTAVLGLVSTVVLASRAAYRVGKDVNAGHYESLMEGLEPEVYDARALIKTYWKQYIPAAAVGTATIACIVGANTLNTRRNAALISVYSLTEKAFSEYQDKVVEQFGKNKEQKVRDELAADRVERNPVSGQGIIVTSRGDVLTMDSHSGRYFESSVETLRKAQNDINAKIISEMYASLNEFYILIGLQPTKNGEEVGWGVQNMLELEFSSVLAEDNRPCLCVDYKVSPVRNYWKFG